MLDDLINLLHRSNGFGKGEDDFLVVGAVVGGELPTFAVFEPFLANLVAAEVEVPYVLADPFEATGLCLWQPDRGWPPRNFFDFRISNPEEFREGGVDVG